MSAEHPGGPGDFGPEPTEEEIRAALEEEMRRVTVDQVLLQSVVSLVNIAGRRMGLAPGSEGEKDLDQVRTAIDAVRALLPVVEPKMSEADAASIRNAVSQLQMAYVAEAQAAGTADPASESKPPPSAGDEGAAPGGEQDPAQGSGPAQSSGRLWVPGQ